MGSERESMADSGQDTDSMSPLRIDMTDLSQVCANGNMRSLLDAIQLESEFGNSPEAPINSAENRELSQINSLKLKPGITRGGSIGVSHSQVNDEHFSYFSGITHIRDHISPVEGQLGPLSKLSHVSKKLFGLTYSQYQKTVAIPNQGFGGILEKLASTPASESHHEGIRKDAYVGPISGLELALEKLHGTRQEVAEGAEDLWEMMEQADVNNDVKISIIECIYRPNPFLITLDQGFLNSLWYGKRFHSHNDLVKSLKMLTSDAKVRPCEEYKISLEIAKSAGKIFLNMLQYLQNQTLLPPPMADIPSKTRLGKIFDGYEATRSPSSLNNAYNSYNGSESDDSFVSGAFLMESRANVRQISIIDGPFDTRAPKAAAISSRFYLKEEVADSGAASRLTVETMKSISFGIAAKDGEQGWDKFSLLQVTDRIRREFNKKALLPSTDVALVVCILDDILLREIRQSVSITFSDIMFSRVDKLLNDVNHIMRNDLLQAKNLHQVIELAYKVELAWHRRFPGRFLAIEQERGRKLLDGVTFKLSSKSGRPSWVPQRNPRVPIDEIQLELEQWWPNIACVYRDGFVNSTTLCTERRVFAIPTVPLLKGIEIYDKAAGCLRYTIEGPLGDLKLSLQTKVGKIVRLLRGYKLKSLLAPEAGIRYDGKYHLTRYGHQYADPTKGVFRMTLWYKRVDDQPALSPDALQHKPSINDDWQLYKNLEDDQMKKSCTALDFVEWKVAEEREVTACKEWKAEQTVKEENDGELHPRRKVV